MLEKSAKQGWSRREFLTGAGVSIGLPFFASLFPKAAWADGVVQPTRLMFMGVPLGFVPNKFLLGTGVFDKTKVSEDEKKNFRDGVSVGWFPEDEGPNYKLPDTHAALEPYRAHISFHKGMRNHKNRGDAHNGIDSWLTCADVLSDPSRTLTNTVSCDQVAASADVMRKDIRFPSLALGIKPCLGTTTGGLSWSPMGMPISPLKSPVQVFDQLFGTDDVPAAVRLARLKQRLSILDFTLKQTNELRRKLNAADRTRLEEVLEAVRGVEANIQREEKWMNVPKPKAGMPRPDAEANDCSSIQHTRTMLELARAAFLTDSTRVITYQFPDSYTEVTHIVKHGLNHPSSPEAEIDANRLDKEMSNQIAYLLKMMCEKVEGRALIDNTVAVYGAGVWGANHGLRSLPVLLMGHGGGMQQGMTRSYDETTPLANLWLTMLKAAGVPVEKDALGKERFADSTGTLDNILK